MYSHVVAVNLQKTQEGQQYAIDLYGLPRRGAEGEPRASR